MSRSVCLIPARGGSKRIPRKNILDLAGKPLIAYTIDVALESGLFSDVILTTDDQEIAEVAKARGAAIDWRPEELSGDMVKFVEVVEEFLLRPENSDIETITGMLPTCPLRTVEDIRAAYALYESHQKEAFVLSVVAYDFPPQLAMTLGDGGRVTMREPNVYKETTRSQSIEKTYHPNGAIYIASSQNFIKEKTFFADPQFAYEMSPINSFDIDYPYQFEIAEVMMRKRLEEEKNV